MKLLIMQFGWIHIKNNLELFKYHMLRIRISLLLR
jgi:hypothetical protein